jgi:DNA-binding transcriptional regulator YiaG
MSPEQCRAARGWLGWSQQELAEMASVGISTVRDFEAGRRQPIANNIAAMRHAIEEAGVCLLFDDTGKATGIELQK